jgi:hypothetical protein
VPGLDRIGVVVSGREQYDRHILASEVKRGDHLHLTVMGGDEYVEVTFKRNVPGETHRHGSDYTVLKWTSWGGEVMDRVPFGQKVWVKK